MQYTFLRKKAHVDLSSFAILENVKEKLAHTNRYFNIKKHTEADEYENSRCTM